MNNPSNTEVTFFLSFTITITLTVHKMAIKLTTYQKSAQSSGFWSLWILLKVSSTVQYADKKVTYRVSLYNKNKIELEPAMLTSMSSNISPSLIWLYVSMNSASEIETWNLCGYGCSSVCFSCATAWLRNLKYSCTEQTTDN